MATQPLPPPIKFLSAGWRLVRRAPGVWVLRGLYEVIAYCFRFVLLFAAGLAVVAHFGSRLRNGLPLATWPDAMLAAAGEPGVVIGLGGMAFVAWVTLFALESFAFAGLWAATKDALVSAPPEVVIRKALVEFPRALGVRALVRATEVTLLVVLVGTFALVAGVAQHVGAFFDGSIVAQAATWAVLLTVASCGAIITRLTAELVAAPVFVEGVGLGEGILRAASTALGHPVYLYRLFIVSAAVAIPALCAAWVAALVQNLFLVTPGGEPLAWMCRFAAEIAIIGGLAAFSVMLHATFFAYYGWLNHQLESLEMPRNRNKKVVTLAQLLPADYPVIATVEDILDPWTQDELLPRDPQTVQTAPSAASNPGRYDLGAILADDEEE